MATRCDADANGATFSITDRRHFREDFLTCPQENLNQHFLSHRSATGAATPVRDSCHLPRGM